MANKPVQRKPETLQDIKKRIEAEIEAEKKRDPEAFKKKYKKGHRVQ